MLQYEEVPQNETRDNGIKLSTNNLPNFLKSSQSPGTVWDMTF